MMKEILIITNEKDITADFIVKQLKLKSVPFYRLNTNCIGRSVEICFDFNSEEYKIKDNILKLEIDLSLIKSVYFRRPELPANVNISTSSEFNFIQNELHYTLEGLYKILDKAFWLNNVRDIRYAENKVLQLLLAKKIGFTIPQSIITNSAEQALRFYKAQHECIIKPIKSGLVAVGEIEEGVIYTSKIELNKEDANRIKNVPVYLQQHILKKGDVRITIVGQKIFPAFIHSQTADISKIDWRMAEHPLEHSRMSIPRDIRQKCLSLLKELNLNFAALDFILDTDGRLIFLEINPNGQWAWIEKRLNYNISESITNLLLEKITN